jgi:hypothetical protein
MTALLKSTAKEPQKRRATRKCRKHSNRKPPAAKVDHLSHRIGGNEKHRTRERRAWHQRRVMRPKQSTREVRADESDETNRARIGNCDAREHAAGPEECAAQSAKIDAGRVSLIV